MALTAKLLEQIEGLNETQVTALIELSKNDEEVQLQKKDKEVRKEVHTAYDADIKEILGKDKPHGVHTYDHLKTLLKELKEQAEAGGDEALKDAKAKIKDLETKLADKAPDHLKEQLETSKRQIEQLRADLETKETELQNKDKANAETIARAELTAAAASATPAEGLSPELFKELVKTRVDNIFKDFHPVIENGHTIWKDKDGHTAINPEDKQRPFTSESLVQKALAGITGEKKSKGGGGGSSQQGGYGHETADLDTSKFVDKVSADKEITRYLGAKGVVNGSEEYYKEATKLRQEHKVNELPMRAPVQQS